MNLEEFDCLLRALNLMSPRQRRAFFELASIKQMRIFEEACYNLVKNKNITQKDIKLLAKKYGPIIKVLAQKKFSVKAKKSILTQKGGFLSALLPVLASIVTSLISK